VSDSGALEAMVDEVLANNQTMVDDYINTDADKRKKKLGGFMGQIMKASKGQANPQQVSQILAQKLSKLI
jgi:aspartyl-tRNA(Asn)/glutamyl-tRNA(Gln) amidotransferase subunit B